MTTTTHAPARAAGAASPTQVRRPSLRRLAVVELRKMTDTRVGFWLMIVIASMAAGMVALQLFTRLGQFVIGPGHGSTFAGLVAGTLKATGSLLPVLGILAITGEWTQRSALFTFTLVPVRWRVVVAKLLAGTALAALSVVVCLAVAALGNLLVGPLVEGNGSWTIEASALGTAFLYQLIRLIMGMAFGMLCMNTPLALVLFFMLPTMWANMSRFIDALQTAREWLAQTVTMAPLAAGEMTADSWAKLAATTAVWVLLPLTIGLARLARREVS